MKYYSYFFVCCILTTLLSCTDNMIDVEKAESFIIENNLFEEGKLSIDIEASKVILANSEKSKILNYAMKFLKIDVDEIVHTEYATASHDPTLITSIAFYLTSNESGKNVPLGFNLVRSKKGNIYRAPDSHSCTGDPCSCCDFVKVGGKIKGCDCDASVWDSDNCEYQSGQKCNHSVTSGS